MANCLAPGFMKFFYTSNGHPHVQVVGISPQNPTGSILNNKGGSTIAFDAAADDLVALFKAYLKTTDQYTGVELYTQADCDSVPVFQFSYDLGGPVAGTGTAANVPWQQLAITFRTVGGGRVKLMIMEGDAAPVDYKAPAAGAGPGSGALAAYAVSNASVIYARDNSFPSIPLTFITKTNDALRKKYLNP